jgi:hypothetical protein
MSIPQDFDLQALYRALDERRRAKWFELGRCSTRDQRAVSRRAEPSSHCDFDHHATQDREGQRSWAPADAPLARPIAREFCAGVRGRRRRTLRVAQARCKTHPSLRHEGDLRGVGRATKCARNDLDACSYREWLQPKPSAEFGAGWTHRFPNRHENDGAARRALGDVYAPLPKVSRESSGAIRSQRSKRGPK